MLFSLCRVIVQRIRHLEDQRHLIGMFSIQREPYSGNQSRLLVAFDIGTFSGASYSILNPGLIPEIVPVCQCVALVYCILIFVSD